MSFQITFYNCYIQAGFPSPAADFFEISIDLNKHLIAHPASTFLFRMKGNAMLDAGIFPDSILIVDRSISPVSGKIVIAEYNGRLLVRHFYRDPKGVTLFSKKDKYFFPLTSIEEISIWGVVTAVIREL